MAREHIEAELQKRRDQLKARKGKPGWGANAKEIEQRIAELEAELASEAE